jgi:hypothetical protein
MPNYSFPEEQREALAWAIAEAARAAAKWLGTEKDLEGAYGPDWAKRLAKEYERMKVLRGLANDLRSPNAATDCAVCLEEFARATRKSVASKSARPAR